MIQNYFVVKSSGHSIHTLLDFSVLSDTDIYSFLGTFLLLASLLSLFFPSLCCSFPLSFSGFFPSALPLNGGLLESCPSLPFFSPHSSQESYPCLLFQLITKCRKVPCIVPSPTHSELLTHIINYVECIST